MKTQILEFWRDEEGATAIEYALIAGLIAAIIIAMFGGLNDGLSNLFDRIKTTLDGLVTGDSPEL